MIRFIARGIARAIRLIIRPAIIIYAWTHRHTVALWGRSISNEARQQVAQRKADPERSKKLLSSLWQVSSDASLENAPELRRIALTDNGVSVDADDTWSNRELLDSRLGGSQS